jgi:hypothetical protein
MMTLWFIQDPSTGELFMSVVDFELFCSQYKKISGSIHRYFQKAGEGGLLHLSVVKIR